jgi:hypothetical protein
VLGGCGIKGTGEALTNATPSLISLPAIQRAAQLTAQSTFLPTALPTAQPSAQPTPTPIVLGPLFEEGLDIKAAPVEVPLELQIPFLKVNAPVLGVGLTSDNEMDAPKGPIGDPIWHTAFWASLAQLRLPVM